MSKKESLITKITIQIAGKEVDVTPDELRSLYQALGELLGEGKETIHIVGQPLWRPYQTWTYPQTITVGGGSDDNWAKKWQVWYSNTSDQSGTVNLLVQ